MVGLTDDGVKEVLPVSEAELLAWGKEHLDCRTEGLGEVLWKLLGISEIFHETVRSLDLTLEACAKTSHCPTGMGLSVCFEPDGLVNVVLLSVPLDLLVAELVLRYDDDAVDDPLDMALAMERAAKVLSEGAAAVREHARRYAGGGD